MYCLIRHMFVRSIYYWSLVQEEEFQVIELGSEFIVIFLELNEFLWCLGECQNRFSLFLIAEISEW